MPGFSFAYASAFVEYVLVVAAVIDARCFHSLKKESNKRILKCQFVRKTNTASSHKEKREAKADDGSDECDWKRRHHGHKECQEICNPKRKKKRAPNSLVFAQYRSTLCALLFVTRLQSLLFSSSSSSVVVARFTSRICAAPFLIISQEKPRSLLVRWSARDTFFLEKKKKEDSLSDFLRTSASAGRDTCVFPPFVFFTSRSLFFCFFGKFRVLIFQSEF